MNNEINNHNYNLEENNLHNSFDNVNNNPRVYKVSDNNNIIINDNNKMNNYYMRGDLNYNLNNGNNSNVIGENNYNINKEINLYKSNKIKEINLNDLNKQTNANEYNSNVNYHIQNVKFSNNYNKEFNQNNLGGKVNNENKQTNKHQNKSKKSIINNDNDNKQITLKKNKNKNKLISNRISNAKSKEETVQFLLNKSKEYSEKFNQLNNENNKNADKRNNNDKNKQNTKQSNNSGNIYIRKNNNKRRKRYNNEYMIKNHPTKKVKSFNIKDILDTTALLAIDDKKFIEPRNYKEIFLMNDKDMWLKAVDEELNNMKRMRVFTIINKVPKDANIISTRWVLKYKRNSEGKIVKYKARLVAKGYSQIYGVDYKNTFSLTLKQDTLKIIIAIAVQRKFHIHQMDIKAAYLNAKLNEDIYMLLPEGMKQKGYCKLNKALYGLKQSGRMWNETLNKVLLKLNFKRFLSDPCVYIKKDKSNEIVCLLAVYVDDIIVTGTDDEIIKTKSLIKNNFEATDVGEVDFIIGIKFVKCNDGYIIHQKKYLNEILNKFNINKYNPVSNTTPIESIELRSKKFNVTKYKQAIGSLLYLAISTRPDILFSVSKSSRKSDNPTYEDWYNVLKIFRYLKGNPNYGIKFTYTNTFNFNVYVDADLGGDKETRKSTTGFVMMINSAPTSWYSKLQHCVSVSTAESEYYGIHECARHCLWYRNIFKELGLKQDVITINTDNKAAIYNCENETINPKSKHIDLRYHSIRELIKKGYINLKYIKSENNLSDGFTKYLNSTLMTRFRNNILYDLNNIKL